MSRFSKKEEPREKQVQSVECLNYGFDSSYMKSKLAEGVRKKARKVSKLLCLIALLLSVMVLAVMYFAELQAKVDDDISRLVDEEIATAQIEERLVPTGTVVHTPVRYASVSTEEWHDQLLDLLDDGDCTTEIVCPCCQVVLREARATHEALADDGDCTTAVGCQYCDQTVVEAKTEHTPMADDNDCTTDILCEHCSHVCIEGTDEHTYTDDNDCTTADVCIVCNKTAVEAKPSHEAMADDGNCTTAVLCQHCTHVMVEAKATHEAMEDDGDCTTDILCQHCSFVCTEGVDEHTCTDDNDCTTATVCTVCNKTVVAARAAHEAREDDGDCTTAVDCQHCGCIAIEANKGHIAQEDDGDCTTDVVCLYCTHVCEYGNSEHTPMVDYDCTTQDCCAVCGTEVIPAKAKHTLETDDGNPLTAIGCASCEVTLVQAPVTFDKLLIEALIRVLIAIAIAVATLVLWRLFARGYAASKAHRYEERKNKEENASYQKFDDLRRALIKQRARVICESMAKIQDNYSNVFLDDDAAKSGRLFLTDRQLEFYDNDFGCSYKNFFIPLQTIYVVEAKEQERGNILTVHCKSGRYEFAVPDAQAGIWRKQILAAKDYLGDRAPFANARSFSFSSGDAGL